MKNMKHLLIAAMLTLAACSVSAELTLDFNLLFENHAAPAAADFPYIGVADDGAIYGRNLFIAASPTLVAAATNSSYVAVSAEEDLSFSGNLWLGVQPGDEIQFHTDNSLTPTTTFDGSTWDFTESALTNALTDAGDLTYGTVPLARLADIDEANLDASVNASLDLADSATQPADSVTTLDGTANRLLWVSGSGDVAEIALGTSGKVLTAAGTTSVPTWETPSAGGGDTFPAWTDYSKNAISTTVALTTSTWTDLALVKPLGGDSTRFNADGSFTFSDTGVFDVVSTDYFTAIDDTKSASLGLELNGDSATRIRGFLYRSQAAAGLNMSGTAFMGYNDNATNKWRIVVWSNSSAANVITSDELTHTSIRRWKNAGE